MQPMGLRLVRSRGDLWTKQIFEDLEVMRFVERVGEGRVWSI